MAIKIFGVAVYCDMNSDTGDALMVLHRCGKKAFEDFTTLGTVDCERECVAAPEMRKRPFPADTR
jgi:hypothetical protein